MTLLNPVTSIYMTKHFESTLPPHSDDSPCTNAPHSLTILYLSFPIAAYTSPNVTPQTWSLECILFQLAPSLLNLSNNSLFMLPPRSLIFILITFIKKTFLLSLSSIFSNLFITNFSSTSNEYSNSLPRFHNLHASLLSFLPQHYEKPSLAAALRLGVLTSSTVVGLSTVNWSPASSALSLPIHPWVWAFWTTGLLPHIDPRSHLWFLYLKEDIFYLQISDKNLPRCLPVTWCIVLNIRVSPRPESLHLSP